MPKPPSLSFEAGLDARARPRGGWRAGTVAFLLSLAAHVGLIVLLGSAIAGSTERTRQQQVRVVLAPPSDQASEQPAAAATPTPAVTPAPEPVTATPSKTLEAAPAAPVIAVASERTHPHPAAAADEASTLATADAAPAPDSQAQSGEAQSEQSDRSAAIELHVLDWLSRHREYPRAARRARLEGVVQVSAVLLPDGRLVEPRVLRSSGYPLLDRAALDLLQRSSPVPRTPGSEGLAQVELHLPIAYRLRI